MPPGVVRAGRAALISGQVFQGSGAVLHCGRAAYDGDGCATGMPAAAGADIGGERMDRGQKEQFVTDLNRRLQNAAVVIVTHYAGLTVAEIGALRAQMRDVGAHFKVTKNRLARRALAGTPYTGLDSLFTGPTAIAFANDVVAAAKVAVQFAKTNPKLTIIGGGFGTTVLDAEAVKVLATLPSLDELRGKLVGLLQAPATRMAGVLQAPAGQLARVVAAHAEAAAAA
jgi:large subunit ribosomal protein L10